MPVGDCIDLHFPKMPKTFRLRIEKAAEEIAKLRAAEDERRSLAGPQLPKDDDQTCKWQGGNLNPTG